MLTFPNELTVADLDKASSDDRWLGFGYLGERQRTGIPADRARQIDETVIGVANSLGWTYEDLFAWANSTIGRHFADMTYGGPRNLPVADAVAEARQVHTFRVPQI